jgi:hypothetical protein
VGSPSSQQSLDRKNASVDADFTTKAYLSNYVHSLDVAKSVLEENGILETVVEPSDMDQPAMANTAEGHRLGMAAVETARPVLDLGYECSLECFASFRDNIYAAYPCIDLGLAKERLDAIFKLSHPSYQGETPESGLDLIDIEISKVVLSIGSLVRSGRESKLAMDLEAHLLWSTDTAMRRDHAQVEDIIMCTLLVRDPTSGGHFGLVATDLIRSTSRPYIIPSNMNTSRRGVSSASLPSSRSS